MELLLVAVVLVLLLLVRLPIVCLGLAIMCLLFWKAPGWALFWFVLFLLQKKR